MNCIGRITLVSKPQLYNLVQSRKMAFGHKWPWDIKQTNKRNGCSDLTTVSESKSPGVGPQQACYFQPVKRRWASIKQTQTQSELLTQYTNRHICDRKRTGKYTLDGTVWAGGIYIEKGCIFLFVLNWPVFFIFYLGVLETLTYLVGYLWSISTNSLK